MHNKIYSSLTRFIKENYLWLLLYLVFITTMIYPLPYYIYTGGGVIDVNDKIEIEDEIKQKGSINLCYVSEIKATLPTYILSYVLPGWDLIKEEELTLADNEDVDDINKRDKLYLEEANQNAIMTAYKYANKSFNITDINNYVIYIDDEAITNLEIGDKLLEVDNKKIIDIKDVINIVKTKSNNDKISIKVLENNEPVNKYAYIREEDNTSVIGISLEKIYSYNTSPSIKLSFKNSESGPSGGLMLSLAIYNKLIEDDITKGLKISGTGTIDEEGNVGSIGGVKYKLKGAVDAKSDIFVVPNGENYEECIELKEKNNYDIKIIGVSTFEEAIKAINK